MIAAKQCLQYVTGIFIAPLGLNDWLCAAHEYDRVIGLKRNQIRQETDPIERARLKEELRIYLELVPGPVDYVKEVYRSFTKT